MHLQTLAKKLADLMVAQSHVSIVAHACMYAYSSAEISCGTRAQRASRRSPKLEHGVTKGVGIQRCTSTEARGLLDRLSPRIRDNLYVRRQRPGISESRCVYHALQTPDMPVAIVRPSFVSGVAGDPYPGYVGNLAGPFTRPTTHPIQPAKYLSPDLIYPQIRCIPRFDLSQGQHPGSSALS